MVGTRRACVTRTLTAFGCLREGPRPEPRVSFASVVRGRMIRAAAAAERRDGVDSSASTGRFVAPEDCAYSDPVGVSRTPTCCSKPTSSSSQNPSTNLLSRNVRTASLVQVTLRPVAWTVSPVDELRYVPV